MTAFEDIASAAVTPKEGFELLKGELRAAGTDADSVAETAYEALRSVTWQFVSAHAAGDEVVGWADVVLRVRQLVRRRGSPVAERLTVLYDMLDQTIRFQRTRQQRDATNGSHVHAILKLLADAKDPVARSAVLERTGLRSANLSRIISNLTAERLVERTSAGREAMLSITAAGRTRLRALPADLPHRGDELVPAQAVTGSAARSVLNETWPALACPIAVWDLSDNLLSCDRAFASAMGYASPVDIEGLPKDGMVPRPALLAEAHSNALGASEIETADGRVFRIHEARGSSGSVWACLDVTDYRNRISELARQERLWRRHFAEHSAVTRHRVDTPSAAGSSGSWALEILAEHSRGILGRLNVISSHAELFRHEIFGELGNVRYGELASDIVSQSEHLRSLVGGITFVEDALRNSFHHDLTRFEPRTLISEIVGNLKTWAHGRHVDFEVDPKTALYLHADRRMLNAVMFPMLHSLCDMADGADSAVTVGADIHGEKIVVSASGKSGWVVNPERFGTHTDVCQQVVRMYGGELDIRYGSSGAVVATAILPLRGPGKPGRRRRTVADD